ncbi:MAG: carboxypeptidase-like regulatory domain-containing protein, partial [Candidatus Thermoplasmatota archaeon]
MRKILVVILSLSLAFPLFLILCMETEGTTNYVAGEVSGTWTSGDLYIVTDNITVPEYKTLTIPPDVTVKFYSGKWLKVYGTLYVNGEENRRVIFTTNELVAQRCAWVGIVFSEAYGWIKNATIEYASIGIDVDRSNIEIIDTKIDGGYREIGNRAAPGPTISYTGGIYCRGSSPKIVNVSISNYYTIGFLGSSYGYNYGIFGEASNPEIINTKISNITNGETSESHLIYAYSYSNFKVVSSELLFPTDLGYSEGLTTTRFTASTYSQTTFIDSSSPIANFSITDSNVTIKNYLDVKVVMIDNITPIEGADLQVIDGSTVIYASHGYGGNDKKTDYNGFAKKIVVTDRIYFSTLTPTENITMVNVKYGAWSESRVVNMSTSHTELFKTDIIPPAKYLRNVTKIALKEVVNEYLASPLVVNVTSESGYPIFGAEVNWEITSYPTGSKNHTLNFTKTFTNSTGEANVTFRVGEKVGEYVVNASVANLTNVSFHIFGIPSKIHHIHISPPNATLPLNATQQFNATPYDVFGNEIEIFEDIKWSTDPIDLGTIDENGTFKASAEPKIGYVIASMDSVEARAQISIYTDIGSLSGVVEDSEGKKLQDVNIKLYLNGSLAFNTTTDANGYYTLTLNIGNYKVNASLAGYSPDEKEVTIIGGERKTLNFVLTKIEMHELSTLNGKVKDSVSNAYIEGVGVSIFYSNGTLAKQTLTNQNGEYSFLNLEKGTYYISADKEGYNPYQAKML